MCNNLAKYRIYNCECKRILIGIVSARSPRNALVKMYTEDWDEKFVDTNDYRNAYVVYDEETT